MSALIQMTVANNAVEVAVGPVQVLAIHFDAAPPPAPGVTLGDQRFVAVSADSTPPTVWCAMRDQLFAWGTDGWVQWAAARRRAGRPQGPLG